MLLLTQTKLLNLFTYVTMKQVIPTYTLVKKSTVLYFGSKEKLEKNSVPLSIEGSGLQVVRMQHLDSAVEWLKAQRTKKSSKALSILCDFEALVAHQLELLQMLKNDQALNHIPVFVHAPTLNDRQLQQLKKLGVDDCFSMPIDWQLIDQKVVFWNKYKKSIKFTTYNFNQTRNINVSILKRIFDIFCATIIILMISPILLIIALAIKIDSKGPIIYRSKRIGKGYQKFDFFKFRSMYQDADERLKQLIHLNQYASSGEMENCFIKIKNDPRITRVGHLIRKTSLDELPQLFNVLKGEMSLVGNRPLPIYEAELMVRDEWAMRFIAPAGLTGLWQVSKRGKNDMSTAERVALDVEYAQNHSFWYDIKLLLKTLPAMIQEEDV